MPPKEAQTEIEQELKIKLSAIDLEKVLSRLKKSAGVASVGHKYLPRHYFDTPDLQLYAQHISLRIQYKQGANGKLGGYEQTVKFELPPKKKLAQGVLVRKECKDVVATKKPDLAAITDSQAKSVMKPFKNKKLVHIFTAAIERRMFNMSVGKGKNRGTVEVAFDVGDIILQANGKHYAFSEIEIELKKGSDKAISAIQKQIMDIAPSARVKSYTSKADEGCRLHRKYGNK